MKIKLIDKKLIRDGWDSPFHFGFIIPFVFIGTFIFVALLLIFSMISFALFYDKGYEYWVYVLNATLTLFAFILIEIPVYKIFHKLNYLHYCKSMLVTQGIVLAGYIFVLYESYVLWLPSQNV